MNKDKNDEVLPSQANSTTPKKPSKSVVTDSKGRSINRNTCWAKVDSLIIS